MSRRAIMTKSDENRPRINYHDDILNFKGIKAISFPKALEEYQLPVDASEDANLFSWYPISKFYTEDLDSNYYWSEYDFDYNEFAYQRVNQIRPGLYKVNYHRLNKKFTADLFNYLKPPTYAYRSVEYYGEKNLELHGFTIALEKDLLVTWENSDLFILYNPSKHLKMDRDNIFWWFMRILKKYIKPSIQKNKIYVVYKGDYGFDKQAFDIKKINLDLNLNYADDFPLVAEKMVNSLNDKKSSGLYILSGETGTGKTSFIRYLAGKLRRNIIFINPDMVDQITDPSFIPFLMENSDSILIIEDAEPALKKRNGGARTGAISNILNLTDGLLSDCLNISIVATFNTDMKNIDEAALRRGRLIYSYMFEKLSILKAQALMDKLGNKVEVNKLMSVAEIYNYELDNKSEAFHKKKIGF